MGLLDFFFPVVQSDSNTPDDSELDYEALYKLGEKWLGEAAENEGDAANAYRREAVEYIAHETGGDFWRWLRGE